MLLGELAGGVAAARVEAGVLVDQLPPQHGAAHRAVVVEVARLQRGDRPRAGHLGPVVGARVAPLAVDDHRGGQHHPVDARLVHGGEQGGGAEVVVTGVRRQVGDRDPGADDRGLVADDVDPAEQVGPRGRRRGLAHVEPGGAGGRHGGAVGALEHQVDPDHLVARGLELLPDRGADEPGRAGQQDLHVTTPGHVVGELDAVGPGAARAAVGVGQRRDRVGKQPREPLQVGLEEREDLLLADALPRLGAGVHVGDQRDRGVALPHLAGQSRLGGAGHVDQVPALRGVVPRLRACGEARTLDDHHRPAAPHPAVRGGHGGRQRTAVGVGEGQVAGAALDVGADPPVGAVDELVGHHHVTRAPRCRAARRRRTAPAPGAPRASAAPTGWRGS